MKKLLFLFLSNFTINSSFGMFLHNTIAPAICQRLQKFGEKIFEMKRLSPVKINKGYFACCEKKVIEGQIITQIYTPPVFTSFLLSYGFRKGVMLHELTHARQPTIFTDSFIGWQTINPHYPHIETEADIEAIRHISCWKCAKEYRNGLIPTHLLFRILTGKSAVKEGYAPLNVIKSLVEEKKKSGEECDYHKALRSYIPYRMSNFIPYLVAFSMYLPGKNKINPMRSMRCTVGLSSSLIARFFIKKFIERKTENKVASGELEP